jgi:D-threo-aldose 1-dehydrogenase
MDEKPGRGQVGRTTLNLPEFGFGAAHLGGMLRRLPEAESRATLQAVWDGGIRYFDTAPFYGLGLSEHRLGGFLLNQQRGEFAVSTKVGRVLHRPKDLAGFDGSSWVGGLKFEVEFNYSYDGFMRSYEQSLMRLGLDTVDALLVHDLDAAGHGDQFDRHVRDLVASGMRALEELKRSGDIRAIGMGVNFADSLEAVAKKVDLDFLLVAVPYTLIDQSILHSGFSWCAANNVSVVIGAPFASGILVTGSGPGARYRYAPATEEVQAKVRAIEAVCRRHGVALAAAALQFPLAHPAVVSIIPGAAHPREFNANLAAFRAPIPVDFWAELKALDLIDRAAPTPD